ncbi:hypothetical protein SAY87_008337 [Trapa incisa]|uniref:Uncharacterized protein n=1 Tax=Trapa incisa TaxID=236973 RepID=A0AAN7KH01_9MYRT|nr:hypothetical protein SAY87_008337 [Trapa incisa]
MRRDQIQRESGQSQLTGHDLEHLQAATLVLGYSFEGLPLPIGGPTLNLVKDFGAGGVVRPDSEVFLLTKDGWGCGSRSRRRFGDPIFWLQIRLLKVRAPA